MQKISPAKRRLGYANYRVTKNNKIRYVEGYSYLSVQRRTQELFGFWPNIEEIERVENEEYAD